RRRGPHGRRRWARRDGLGAGALDLDRDQRHPGAGPRRGRRREHHRAGGAGDDGDGAPAGGGGAAGMTRILLVDDSEEVRRSMRSVLVEAIAGATFGEAGDAAQALAAIARAPWDLVLLDLSLPDRSGFDVLRDMRRQ